MAFGYLGALGKFGLSFAFGAGLLLAPKLVEFKHLLVHWTEPWPWKKYAIAHALCFVALIGLGGLFGAGDSLHLTPNGAAPITVLYALFSAALFGFLATALLVFGPFGLRVRLARRESVVLLLALAACTLYWIAYCMLPQLEQMLADFLFPPTVALAGWLDGLCGYQTTIDSATRAFGTSDFSVTMAPSCLGSEGAGLVFMFIGAYLYSARQDLRFPQALAVLPLAVLVMWLLNAVRVAALVVIGTSWSEQVAMDGFHSAAGWINFLLVYVAALLLLRNHSAFARTTGGIVFGLTEDTVKLVPQLALIAATLITLLFTAGFDWLYPARCSAGRLTAVALSRALSPG